MRPPCVSKGPAGRTAPAAISDLHTPAASAWEGFVMRGIAPAIFGVLAFVAAGFVHGGLRYSADPELVLAGSYGLAACGLVGVLAGGVALGIQIARE